MSAASGSAALALRKTDVTALRRCPRVHRGTGNKRRLSFLRMPDRRLTDRSSNEQTDSVLIICKYPATSAPGIGFKTAKPIAALSKYREVTWDDATADNGQEDRLPGKHYFAPECVYQIVTVVSDNRI
jgi:hypothetical protein